MFTFFKPAEKTRLESTPELAEIIVFIKKLEAKDEQLKAIVASNAANRAFRKSSLLTNIVSKLNNKIQIYNSLPKSGDSNHEVVINLRFVRSIKEFINAIIQENKT